MWGACDLELRQRAGERRVARGLASEREADDHHAVADEQSLEELDHLPY